MSSTVPRLKGRRPLPLSVMPGIHYPALPVTADAVILALLYQFEQSEWWSSERLLEYQLRQAAMLLEHAQRSVPFYKSYLSGLAGYRDEPMTAEIWRQIPILTRSQIQDSGEQMISRALPKDHRDVQWILTSGSTGQPLKALLSSLHLTIFKAINLRYYLWHGLDLDAKVAAIRRTKPGAAEPPAGHREPGYWAAAHPTGSAVVLNVAASLTEQIAWLERERPAYLLSYATNIRALALHCEELGRQLPSLRAVTSHAEVLDADLRAVCRRVWNVPVLDSYSANEAGMIALQCPENKTYHIMAEGMLVEILDEDDRPCPPGGIGRLVLTPLHNFAMPFIRYAIGDYAEVGEPCPCGRGLPVLERILGRSRDMVILPSGERRWFNISSGDLTKIEPLRQWQIVQREPEVMDVTLALSRPFTGEEQARFTEVLHQAFGYPFELTFKYVDAIPREASGKYADFRCEIEDPGV